MASNAGRLSGVVGELFRKGAVKAHYQPITHRGVLDLFEMNIRCGIMKPLRRTNLCG